MKTTSVVIGEKRVKFLRLVRAKYPEFKFSNAVKEFIDDSLLKKYPVEAVETECAIAGSMSCIGG